MFSLERGQAKEQKNQCENCPPEIPEVGFSNLRYCQARHFPCVSALKDAMWMSALPTHLFDNFFLNQEDILHL